MATLYPNMGYSDTGCKIAVSESVGAVLGRVNPRSALSSIPCPAASGQRVLWVDAGPGSFGAGQAPIVCLKVREWRATRGYLGAHRLRPALRKAVGVLHHRVLAPAARRGYGSGARPDPGHDQCPALPVVGLKAQVFPPGSCPSECSIRSSPEN